MVGVDAGQTRISQCTTHIGIPVGSRGGMQGPGAGADFRDQLVNDHLAVLQQVRVFSWVVLNQPLPLCSPLRSV